MVTPTPNENGTGFTGHASAEMKLDEPAVQANWLDALKVYFFRIAVGSRLPPTWFEKHLPPVTSRAKKTGRLHIEIVSHCWQYSHMLLYQLSSLVLYPPKTCGVTMTVYYSPEDLETTGLLEFFSGFEVPGVRWNWRPLHRYALFRRSIGRNHAAKETGADWIWFTDCDLLFHDNCLDGLSACLQAKQDALVYPREERTTPLLTADDPLLATGKQVLEVRDIQPEQFEAHVRTRATGPLQITHGDVARACGYCDAIKVYQKPAKRWCKAHEDRAFRWLLETQGLPVDVPGVYRIRHIEKGRYNPDSASSTLRQKTRAVQSAFRGE